MNKIKEVIEKLNPYPEYFEKSHLTDGSEECFWAERNKKIVEEIIKDRHRTIQKFIKGEFIEGVDK